MLEGTVKNVVMFEDKLMAVSVFSDAQIEIIGEQLYVVEDREIEQYLYNIVGYTTANGKPFASMKANIILL